MYPIFRYCRSASRRSRRGLSLMEVILAIAILGGSLAVLGQLLRVAASRAVAARDLATAQLLCESKMAELLSTGVAPQPVSMVAFETYEAETGWWYSVSVQPLPQEGLLEIQVLVEQDLSASSRPVSYRLVRWIVDPDVELDILMQASEAAAAASSSSSSSSSSGRGS